jgi:hypothetical protein
MLKLILKVNIHVPIIVVIELLKLKLIQSNITLHTVDENNSKKQNL